MLELIIVIIIIAILATLGLIQYGRMIEKSRRAEAQVAFSTMRILAHAYFLEHGSLLEFPINQVGLPLDSCESNYYFYYTYALLNPPTYDTLLQQAWRCGPESGGKPPEGTGFIQLTSNLNTGSDIWEMSPEFK